MKQVLIAITLFINMLVVTTSVNAASQEECKIWLCLPGGFPSGCGDAYSAMLDRVKHLKPPLPSFSSCAVNPPSGSGSHMSSLFGTAAYVPPYKYCSSWGYRKQGDDDNVKYCKGYSYTEEKYVKGTICRKIRTGDSDEYRMSPEHCSRTYRYVEVYTEGAQQGPTHYF